MRIVAVLILVISVSCNAQESPKHLEEVVKHGSYGKLRGDKLLYYTVEEDIGLVVNLRYLGSTQSDRLIAKEAYSPPIGWISNESVLLFKKRSDGYFIYQLNISTGEVESSIKTDSVFQPELYVANSGKMLVYANHYLKDPELKAYKYDFESEERTQLTQLTGRRVQRIACNYEKNVIAFVERKENQSYLNLLDSGIVREIQMLKGENDSSERPLVFSSDGRKLFYVSERDGRTTLYNYELDIDESNELFHFDKGVKCIDLSYSDDQLLITVEGKQTKSIIKQAEDVDNDYQVELEFPYSIYSLSN